MRSSHTSNLANHVSFTIRIPRVVYDYLAELWGLDGSVPERAAILLAQAATFGGPAELYQELEAATEELAGLRAQVETVALLLAEADIRPAGRHERMGR